MKKYGSSYNFTEHGNKITGVYNKDGSFSSFSVIYDSLDLRPSAQEYGRGSCIVMSGAGSTEYYSNGVTWSTPVAVSGETTVTVGAVDTTIAALSDVADDIVIDAQARNNFSLSLTKNHLLLNPINLVAGRLLHIACTQDAAGGRLIAYDTLYRFSGNSLLSTKPDSLDLISCYYDGANLLCSIQKGFASPAALNAYIAGSLDFANLQASGLLTLI